MDLVAFKGNLDSNTACVLNPMCIVLFDVQLLIGYFLVQVNTGVHIFICYLLTSFLSTSVCTFVMNCFVHVDLFSYSTS